MEMAVTCRLWGGLLQVEAVSLAFEFLKDETDSILTDTDGNIEPLESEEQNRSSVFRFRPPPITAFTKYVPSFNILSLVLRSILAF